MSVRQFRDVIFYVLGDGASTSFSVDLSSAPVSLLPQTHGGTVAITSPGFDFRVSPPADIEHISVSDPANPGSTATATLERSVLSVNLSAAPDNALNLVEIFTRLSF